MSFKNIQKPTEQDDLLTEFNSLYPSYNQDRSNSYQKFIQKNLETKPNLFMSMKQSYLNLVHSITKNAAVATLVMLLMLGTVGTSAAQLVAPEEYKPSKLVANLFAANKQKETDPYTALTPDENNDVAISNECDLAMKYPKIISQSKVNIFRENESVPPTEPSVIDGFNVSAYPNVMEEFEAQFQQNGKVEAEKVVTFRCLEMDRLDAMKKYFDQRVSELGAQKIDFSKDKLRELTGWFVTEADIQNLNYTRGDNYLGENHNEIYFTFNNKIYWAIFSSPSDETKGVFGNQVQIQFNSLVKNEASSEILQGEVSQNMKKQSSSLSGGIQPLVADENHDVVVLKECDLAIKLKKLSDRTVTKGFVNGLNVYNIGDVFNVRCQRNKSFDDFLNQDVKTLPIPNIDKIQQTQQIGDIKSKINGTLETKSQGDFTLESYADAEGVVVFELENSSIVVLIAASNPGADLSEIVELQSNSLAPSIPSKNLESMPSATEESMNIGPNSVQQPEYQTLRLYGTGSSVGHVYSDVKEGGQAVYYTTENQKLPEIGGSADQVIVHTIVGKVRNNPKTFDGQTPQLEIYDIQSAKAAVVSNR